MAWIKWSSALLALVGTIWLGAGTVATKDDVGVVAGSVQVVQNKMDRHIVNDEIFYTQRRIWQIKEQAGVNDCIHAPTGGVRNECMRLELKVDQLEKEREALTR